MYSGSEPLSNFGAVGFAAAPCVLGYVSRLWSVNGKGGMILESYIRRYLGIYDVAGLNEVVIEMCIIVSP